jgi:hypothetical protein
VLATIAVATPRKLHFIEADPRKQGSIALAGEGRDSVIHWVGPINTEMLGVGETSTAPTALEM